jgi:hypothetical protein
MLAGVEPGESTEDRRPRPSRGRLAVTSNGELEPTPPLRDEGPEGGGCRASSPPLLLPGPSYHMLWLPVEAGARSSSANMEAEKGKRPDMPPTPKCSVAHNNGRC